MASSQDQTEYLGEPLEGARKDSATDSKQINVAVTQAHGPVAENTTISRHTIDSSFIGASQSVEEATDVAAAQEEIDVPDITTTAGGTAERFPVTADESSKDTTAAAATHDEADTLDKSSSGSSLAKDFVKQFSASLKEFDEFAKDAVVPSGPPCRSDSPTTWRAKFACVAHHQDAMIRIVCQGNPFHRCPRCQKTKGWIWICCACGRASCKKCYKQLVRYVAVRGKALQTSAGVARLDEEHEQFRQQHGVRGQSTTSRGRYRGLGWRRGNWRHSRDRQEARFSQSQRSQAQAPGIEQHPGNEENPHAGRNPHAAPFVPAAPPPQTVARSQPVQLPTEAGHSRAVPLRQAVPYPQETQYPQQFSYPQAAPYSQDVPLRQPMPYHRPVPSLQTFPQPHPFAQPQPFPHPQAAPYHYTAPEYPPAQYPHALSYAPPIQRQMHSAPEREQWHRYPQPPFQFPGRPDRRRSHGQPRGGRDGVE